MSEHQVLEDELRGYEALKWEEMSLGNGLPVYRMLFRFKPPNVPDAMRME